MNSRKFCRYFLIIILGYIALNAILWHVYTLDTFALDAVHDKHGSFMRFSGIVIPNNNVGEPTYGRRHMEYKEYIQHVEKGDRPQVDVLTLGDSFSNGNGGAFYQDFLTRDSDLEILNIPCMPDQSGLSMLYILDSIGYLDEICPKVVIVESIERFIGGRFVTPLDPSRIMIDEKMFRSYYKTEHKGKEEEIAGKLLPGVMMKANWDVLSHYVYRATHENVCSQKVSYRMLDRDLFTSRGYENKLLFFQSEMETGKLTAQKEKINDNFNKVAEHLAQKGITVIFMPAVDKYDLYYDEIANHEGLQRNSLLEELEAMPKSYVFVNGKTFLKQAVADGETDLYWTDDDHWTWKGAEVVARGILPLVKKYAQ